MGIMDQEGESWAQLFFGFSNVREYPIFSTMDFPLLSVS